MSAPDLAAAPGGDPATALAQLLAEERACLLSGDLAALPRLILAKERLLELVQGASAPPAEVLDRLKAAAERNQALLDAALRGVQAARARLETVRNGGPALNTYDAAGRSSTVGGRGPSVERRA
jgi:flagellar biosynthesis/type III secretory pathway chaperone